MAESKETPILTSDGVVVVLRIQSPSAVLIGRLIPFAFSEHHSLKQLLSIYIAAAFANAGDLDKPYKEFADWSMVRIFQEGHEITLSTRPGELRSDRPLVCVIAEDSSFPGAAIDVISRLLQEALEQKRQTLQVDRFAQKLAEYIQMAIRASGTSGVPISQERHWMAADAVLTLKRFFFAAVSEISARLQANSAYPEIGLTSELVFNVFARGLSRYALNDLLRPSGIRLTIECEESGSAERVLGADLGFCISILGHGLTLRRAILCQAKRLHPVGGLFNASSRYGDLMEPAGRTQAEKMLGITPCAYFLLYNPTDLKSIAAGLRKGFEALESLDYADDGILVLPATFVRGAAGASFQTVMEVLPFTSSFVKFMVDDFIQGKLGDSGQRAVAAALTRGLRRAAEVDHMDVPVPRFSVTFTLDMSQTESERR